MLRWHVVTRFIAFDFLLLPSLTPRIVSDFQRGRTSKIKQGGIDCGDCGKLIWFVY